MPAIRPYRPDDAPALNDLYRRSVLELGPRGYAPDQVEEWANLAPSPEHFRALMVDGRYRLVAADDDDLPLAFADLETDGHIHFFYCAPEAAGRGVASRLYEALEEAARNLEIGRLYAEASEVALPFFLKHGFRHLGRRDFEVAGTPIHNHAVEKIL
ncbi:GNAT family N-acetyltransferase [Stappia sp. F7233]|uniref:GNAT family N-acetyltransferase n=1 Tax=Stappia albiluteola TaxID=2758565 RepID=A0A839AAN0_9HYPH|nr:GNAT family N-acetyltransferase [Stappia albiluteola]MBA5776633.1 GNAT family N-acetyltransferase [Stappia albiluteola]